MATLPLTCTFTGQGGIVSVVPTYSRLGLLGFGSCSRFASINARHTASTALTVASPPARVSAIALAMLQKLSPGCTTRWFGTAVGAGAGGAGGGGTAGGAVVVVAGAVVVVVAGAVVVVAGAAVVLVVVAAVVGGAVGGAAVVLGSVVLGAVVVVAVSDSTAPGAGSEDTSCGPPATGAPLPQPARTVAKRPNPTSQRTPRVTART
ncbi:MAG: hypothetical protein QOI95_4249 [Acidimicrobiaceae bacterium]